jgi:periplasmic divalent cation tolerance protein
MEYVLLYCTVPSMELGGKIASALVSEKLVACVNISSEIRSIYTWEGKIEDEKEYLLTMKTRINNFDEIETRIKEIHTYKVPEIIAIPIIKGSKEYLNWIENNTKKV